MQQTRSELLRENEQLRDRKELLELRQKNRDLQRQIARLEAGKRKRSNFLDTVMENKLLFSLTALTVICGGIGGGILLFELVAALKAISAG